MCSSKLLGRKVSTNPRKILVNNIGAYALDSWPRHLLPHSFSHSLQPGLGGQLSHSAAEPIQCRQDSLTPAHSRVDTSLGISIRNPGGAIENVLASAARPDYMTIGGHHFSKGVSLRQARRAGHDIGQRCRGGAAADR
jgi:hypothetical protein